MSDTHPPEQQGTSPGPNPFAGSPLPMRLGLFFAVNAGVLATLCLVTQSRPESWLWAPILGSVSALVSLFLSKWLATRGLVKRYLDPQHLEDEHDALLHSMVVVVAEKAGLPSCPKVGIYEDEGINAFATGWRRGGALLMFSSGLVACLDDDPDAVLGVVAHEVAHVANGDMLTLTLVQAVVNSLVVLVSMPLRLLYVFTLFGEAGSVAAAWLIALARWVLVLLLTFFGSLVVKWFSRWREFRADQGAAWLTSPHHMVQALRLVATGPKPHLARHSPVAALGIQGRGAWLDLFGTHPSVERRLARFGVELKGL